MNIKEIIKKNRPKISDSSITTYYYIIKKLIGDDDIDVLKNYDKIYNEKLENIEPKKRKTMISAIIVMLDDDNNKDIIKKYRDLMMEDNEKSLKIDYQNKKTDKQANNWIDYDEIIKIYKKLEKEVKPIINKDKITMSEFQQYQNYIILSIYTCIPPRRLQDYTEMKIRNYNEKNDNYIDKKIDHFYFNKYKTSKYYNLQIVKIPNKLKSILKKWLHHFNKSDYLLVDSNMNRLSPITLNQRLNKIFKKPISVNMIRHAYISHLYPDDMPKLEELNKIAHDMGHNINEQQKYIKK
jgi:hypothetical protein